jgi:hypothetical protein
MTKKLIYTLIAVGLLVLMMASVCLADSTQQTAPVQDSLVIAQVDSSVIKPPPARPLDAKAMTERIQALEKENLVLREDLGKARLDSRSDMQAMAKKNAEEVSKLNQQLADLNAKAAAEKRSNAKRNRNLWIAVGVVAIGALAN